MKLIIDIPEAIKNRLCFGVTFPKDIQTVCEALNDGIPIPDNATVCNIEQIRAEIENLTYYWCEINPKYVIDDVLQIIDKYKI